MNTGPLRILVVDDNADAASMLKFLLKSEGHGAFLAFDGPEAVATAKLVRPDVVLLDLTLPGMSGIDVAVELGRTPELSGCKIVAITGHGDEVLPSPSPFHQHFQKPVSPAALLRYLSGLQAGQMVPCPAASVA